MMRAVPKVARRNVCLLRGFSNAAHDGNQLCTLLLWWCIFTWKHSYVTNELICTKVVLIEKHMFDDVLVTVWTTDHLSRMKNLSSHFQRESLPVPSGSSTAHRQLVRGLQRSRRPIFGSLLQVIFAYRFFSIQATWPSHCSFPCFVELTMSFSSKPSIIVFTSKGTKWI